MMFALMRHGEPDWEQVAGVHYRGAANDWAPLTDLGVHQAKRAAQTLRAQTPPARVISSPMTRALQTASIVAASLQLPLSVDLRLHEWLPAEDFSWSDLEGVMASYDDMISREGVRPADHALCWEPLPQVRSRVESALIEAATEVSSRPILVVCHEVVIHAMTGHQHTAHAEIRTLEMQV